MPTEAEMKPEERRDYERECVAQAQAVLDRLGKSPHEVRKGLEARLEGSYPKTAIVVRVWDEVAGEERTYSYRLWRHPISGHPVFEGVDSQREAPESVGNLVATWAFGG
jgi:hypothetical protein